MEVSKKKLNLDAYRLPILLSSCALAIALYIFLPQTCPEPARRTASILLLAAIFWVTEFFPPYVTSLLVILSLTFALTIFPDVLQTGFSDYTFFLSLFADPVLMLFLGGFTLGSAFSKYGLDNQIAKRIIDLFGLKPFPLLLGTMLTTTFIGLWISNTATAVIMLAIIQPFLRDPKIESSYKKALVLCIPFAASIGGTGTPIASPPNAIAIGLMEQKGIYITFLEWMLICLPLVAVRITMASLVLKYFFPVRSKEIPALNIKYCELNYENKFILLIAFCIVTLFVTKSLHGIPEAITAIICLTLMTATGLLNQQDIRRLDWDILILMWGGLALGLAVDKSGLGHWIVNSPLLEYHGTILIIIIGLITFVLSSFISNTATAALMLPLALSIEEENKTILAITVTIISSMGLALPIASPPNALAFSTNHISSKDMFVVGLVVDILSLMIIFSGFWIVIPAIL